MKPFLPLILSSIIWVVQIECADSGSDKRADEVNSAGAAGSGSGSSSAQSSGKADNVVDKEASPKPTASSSSASESPISAPLKSADPTSVRPDPAPPQQLGVLPEWAVNDPGQFSGKITFGSSEPSPSGGADAATSGGGGHHGGHAGGGGHHGGHAGNNNTNTATISLCAGDNPCVTGGAPQPEPTTDPTSKPKPDKPKEIIHHKQTIVISKQFTFVNLPVFPQNFIDPECQYICFQQQCGSSPFGARVAGASLGNQAGFLACQGDCKQLGGMEYSPDKYYLCTEEVCIDAGDKSIRKGQTASGSTIRAAGGKPKGFVEIQHLQTDPAKAAKAAKETTSVRASGAQKFSSDKDDIDGPTSLEPGSNRVIGANANDGKIRGVNLGGWLLAEPFITPSLFRVSTGTYAFDEWTLCAHLENSEGCGQRLENHLQTFYTEADIKRIASLGVTHVRIPIGYWAFQKFDNDKFYKGSQLDHLRKAIDWCRSARLKVMIDLHGVPGAQNPFDNSGQANRTDWATVDKSVDVTLEVLQMIADEFGNARFADVVDAIGVLNEPAGFVKDKITIPKLEDFYKRAYDTISKKFKGAIVFHDAFLGHQQWNKFLTGLGKQAMLDLHTYEVFALNNIYLPIQGHLTAVRNFGNDLVASDKAIRDGGALGTVVGEFSAALTDCAPFLNGVAQGSRYDGTRRPSQQERKGKVAECDGWEDAKNLSDAQRRKIIAFMKANLEAFSSGKGYYFWTAKTETNLPGWSLFTLAEQKLVQVPL